MSGRRMLITGAAGMVGSMLARRALDRGYEVTAVVRPNSDRQLLAGLRLNYVVGDLAEPASISTSLTDADLVVHAAAKIGDWGPPEQYRAVNVTALEHLVNAALRAGTIQRWIQISTLGVYAGHDHYGTDESVPPDAHGLDGYTRTKAEAELLLQSFMREHDFPAVILRPGFIYGPGERHSLPRLIELFETGKIKFIGGGRKLLNNTYVGNLVEAILLAADQPQALGETFNIRDQRLVTREEYLMTVADYLGKPRPTSVPLWLAQAAVPFIEGWARWRKSTKAPILTRARIKFMSRNLDFSIEKARRMLGYHPTVDFQDGIREALDWAMEQA